MRAPERAGDALITPNGISPQDPASWTATQLARASCSGSRHDVIFLAGHFSANSALAADFTTSVLTTDLGGLARRTSPIRSCSAPAATPATTSSTRDAIPGVTLPLDWAQAFARKKATLIAGTGYQYGDTDFLEYSERLYHNFARQLRAGRRGRPSRSAKRWCRRSSTTWRRRRTSAASTRRRCSRRRCSGCRCSAVNMPAGRGGASGHRRVSSRRRRSQPVPAQLLGLQTYDLGVAPNLTPHTQTLKNVSGGRRASSPPG